ncbi:MAG: threonylcarbamoyl-AMP synthase [Flavobacteriaceae bacterium]|nr:threonylcarbamoyl-AMP synthase [Flavobacteriaceae bacterium]
MDSEILKAKNILDQKGVIIYPTDTIWGIGCDATNEEAVAEIYKLKQRAESKSLIILVDGWAMLKEYIKEVPNKVSCIINGSSKPTSVIYNNPIKLAKNVIAQNNTVAIRIVKDEFCKQLIRQFGKPIVSTSANVSGKPAPKNFDEIENSLLNKVDYVVNLHLEKKQSTASQIVRVDSKGKIEFIRK